MGEFANAKRLTSPGNSGRWLPSPSPLSQQFEAESFTSSRDLRSANQVSSHRASFSSSLSDGDHSYRRGGAEHAYSFVRMHSIFYECKSSVTVLKFGHMSSDLLAYGASDGTLTVCSLSEEPSVLKQLTGHSNDVTCSINCHWSMFPQIFIKREFMGGSYIILNMHKLQEGELEKKLKDVSGNQKSQLSARV